MNSTELREHVLAILKQGPTYGAAISLTLDADTDRATRIGRILDVLHSLEKQGLVEAWWTQETFTERGDRPRRMYRLRTDAP